MKGKRPKNEERTGGDNFLFFLIAMFGIIFANIASAMDDRHVVMWMACAQFWTRASIVGTWMIFSNRPP